MIDQGTSVLVTGGAGFIGSHLVEQLVASDAQVTVIDNLATGDLANLQAVRSQIHLVVDELGDLVRGQQIDLSEYEYVFHLAANPYIPPSVENPIYDFNVNLRNTLMLLEALRGIPDGPRLVNTSSAAVYGNPARLPIQESDPTIPISPYGVSKLAAERYVAVYSQIYGVRATSLRLFSAYGPRQRKQVMYDLLCKLRANPTRLEVLGDGSQARDFTYVDDVVQAMMLAATEAPCQGEVYNVASGKTYSIEEMVRILCSVCDLAPDVVYTGNTRLGDAEKWIVDITRLKQLGFEPQTSLETGLETIRGWYDATVQ